MGELEGCTLRGRKTDLIRNYAMLGYQRALNILEKGGGEDAVAEALAKLFSPGGDAPPDFRMAEEFIRVRNKALADTGRPPAAAAAAKRDQVTQRVPAPVPLPQASADEGAAQPPGDVQPVKKKHDWGSLGGLVGGQSKN